MGATALIGSLVVAAGTGIYTATRSAPKPPPAPLMPDQTSVQNAQQIAEEQAASMRQGRASTVLTDNAGTGDKLGP